MTLTGGAIKPASNRLSPTLVSAQLRSAVFSSADLSGAYLSFSNLTGAKMLGTNLSAADVSFVIWTDSQYNESTIFPSGSAYATKPWGLDGNITPWDAGMIPVPEPSIGMLLGFGVLGVAGVAASSKRGSLSI